jgi:hypothetical protein
MKHAVIRPPRSDRVKVAVADGGDRDKGPPQRVSQGVDVGAGGVPLEQVHDDRAVEDQHRGGQQEPAQVPAPEHRPDQPETEDHAHRRDGDRDEGKRGGPPRATAWPGPAGQAAGGFWLHTRPGGPGRSQHGQHRRPGPAGGCRQSWSSAFHRARQPTRHISHPGLPARTMQGMARVRSGQATAWPLVPDRRGCRGSAAQGWVQKMLSAKRFERIFGCP